MARRRSVLVVAVVVLLGGIGTVMSAATLHVSARQSAERAFTQARDIVAGVVTAEIVQYGLALSDLAAALGAQSQLSAGDFAAMTATINPQRLPGATEVDLIVPATIAGVPALEARWRATGLALAPASRSGGEHYFSVLGGR